MRDEREQGRRIPHRPENGAGDANLHVELTRTDPGTCSGAYMMTRAPQAMQVTQASMPIDPISSTAQGITDSGTSFAIRAHSSAPASES